MVLRKVLFSLVYYNGNASPIPPQPYNEFSNSLHGEFHNTFRGLMLTVQQALLEVDRMANAKDYSKRLAAADDLGPFFRSFVDELPSQGAF